LDYKEGGVIMDRQEIINNIGYIADKKAKEYVEQRKSHGVNDPYMLNEIEEAYYEGMVQSENFWHPASELPPLDKNGGSGLVYALCKVFSKEYGEYLDKVLYRVRVMHGKWEPEDIEVEWWCYPPKEE
jgi:hypothetical protein